MWKHEKTRLFPHVSRAGSAETARLESFQEEHEEEKQVTDYEYRECDKPVSGLGEIQYEHNAQRQDATDNQSDFIHEMISFSSWHSSKSACVGWCPAAKESDSKVPLKYLHVSENYA